MLLLQTQSLGRNRPDRRIQHHYAADCGTHHRPYRINANSLTQHCNQATFAQIFIVAGVAKRRIGQDFTELFLHELSGVLTAHLIELIPEDFAEGVASAVSDAERNRGE